MAPIVKSAPANARRLIALLSAAILASAFALPAGAAQYPSIAMGASDQAVIVTASTSQRWTRGEESVLFLTGSCSVRSGASVITADGAVLWLVPTVDPKTGESAVDVFAEKNVSVIEHGLFKKQEGAIYARMKTRIGLNVQVPVLTELPAPPNVPLYVDALKARYPKEPLPWPAPTLEETLFARKDIQVVANTYSIEKKEQVTQVFLHGNVKLENPELQLFADDVLLWIEPAPGVTSAEQNGELAGIYAEGSVVIFGHGSSIRADQFYLDPRTFEGLATKATFRTDDPKTGSPMLFYSDAMRQLDRNTMLARVGYVTTCEFAEPDYRLAGHNMRAVLGSPRFTWLPESETNNKGASAKKTGAASPKKPAQSKSGQTAAAGAKQPTKSPNAPATPKKAAASANQPSEEEERRFTPDSVVISSHENVGYIGALPVFYWPFLAHDVTSGGYLLQAVTFQSGKEFGPTIKTSWNLYDLGVYYNDWSNLVLNLDYYAKRGLGMGLDFEYEGPSSFGFITTYYIHDRAKTELGGTAKVENPDRGRILWRHRQLLEDDWRADFEFAYRSDRNFMPVFFQKEWFEGKPPETLVYLRKLDDNRAYTALLKVRVNDFDTTVERLPELGLISLAEPLWENRLLWDANTSLSYLRLKYDEKLKLKNPDPTVRFDTEHSISYPFSIGWLNLDPYVGAAFTGYSNQANSNTGAGRVAAYYGLRAGTDFYRTYDAENDLFDIHGIRHIITPIFDFRDNVFVSKSPLNFTQYDDSIDGRHEGQEFLFRLRNRWQTKRGPIENRHIVNFLTADIDFDIFRNQKNVTPKPDDFIEFNGRWQVNDFLALTSSRTRYDLTTNQFGVINAGFDLTYWNPIRINYSHDFIRSTVTGKPVHSISSLKLAYQPEWSRWRVEIEESYDFKGNTNQNGQRPKNLGTTLAVTRDLHCWLLTVSISFSPGKKAGGVSFGIQLQPKIAAPNPVEL